MTDKAAHIGSAEIIQAGSKSFASAARLFKREIRDDVYDLYRWCRYCDDEIDGQELGFNTHTLTSSEQQQRLADISTTTKAVLAGQPTENPAFLGLQRVVDNHHIPPHYPLDLVEGFAMDVQGYRYRTLDDTLLYAYHVAGVVGVMMSYVMNVRDPAILCRAADLGIAFQLTNIARDVMDDAGTGRVYLPSDWLAEVGVPLNEISAPENRDAVFEVVQRLLREAERFYVSSREGIRELPLSCAWAISAADFVYHNIGDRVIGRGAHAWDSRTYTPTYRKLYWVMRGGFSAMSAVGFHKGKNMRPRDPTLWLKPGLA
jgi:phytoene synthase